MATVRLDLKLAAYLLSTCMLATVFVVGLGQRLRSTQIAYVATRSGQSRVYLLDIERNTEHVLTSPPVIECCLKWSPDGTQLTLVSNRSFVGNTDIYVFDFTQQRLKQLTTTDGNDWSPVWSPNGLQLAYISYRDGNAELYVMNADGSNQTRLTTTAYFEVAPQWSDDGQRIGVASLMNDAPASYLGIPAGLYTVMPSCRENCTRVPEALVDADLVLLPTESFRMLPDNRLIVAAFNRDRGGGYGFYAFSENATNTPELLTYNADLNPPSITSSGQWVAFISGDVEPDNFIRHKHIYVLNTDCVGTTGGCSSELKRLAEAVDADTGLSLSPDGDWVIFSANWSGSPELYRMRTSEGQPERLTWNDTPEISPAWRPE